MPDDQQIRRQLLHYADGVGVDVEGDLARVLETSSGSARSRHQMALLTAVPLVVVAIVAGVLVGTRSMGAAVDRGTVAPAPQSRLTGTWTRALVAGEELPVEAAGTWTMVVGADGALALVPPDAWTAEHFQPNGEYVRSGDSLRTNVFASESCDGSVGAYSFTVGHASLQLSATGDGCPLRTAVLDGRWERGP